MRPAQPRRWGQYGASAKHGQGELRGGIIHWTLREQIAQVIHRRMRRMKGLAWLVAVFFRTVIEPVPRSLSGKSSVSGRMIGGVSGKMVGDVSGKVVGPPLVVMMGSGGLVLMLRVRPSDGHQSPVGTRTCIVVRLEREVRRKPDGPQNKEHR